MSLVQPSISVIMPVYNAAAYLGEAIESILNQQFSSFEFFIIDDASQDNSVAIIELYTDPRIQLIKKPVNTGYTDSLNMAIKLSKGKYIARMDADDVSLPTRFEEQFKYLERNPSVLVLGTNYRFLGTNEEVKMPTTDAEARVEAIISVPVAHPTVFVRREVFFEHGLFYNRTAEPSEDYELWNRVLTIGEMANLDSVQLLYRKHAMQVSTTKYLKIKENVFPIRKNNIGKIMDLDSLEKARFVIDVLAGYKGDLINSKELLKRQALFVALLQGNATKRQYDPFFLAKYLRRIWLIEVKKYKPAFLDFKTFFQINRFAITRVEPALLLTLFIKILIPPKLMKLLGNVKNKVGFG